jgi:hypothetical protein
MNEILTAVEDMAANLLSPKPTAEVTREVILDAVKKSSSIMSSVNTITITDDDINLISRRLEERFDITMLLGTLFADEYRPWLDNARGEIDWYYWNRYRRYLNKSGFPPQVLGSMDIITDQILDHLEDPRKKDKWNRKGMVVGHVQSGKTANYTALINKAADSGYKVIIILAGTLNALRNQTQFRLDGGFIGTNTDIKQPIGVGLISNEKKPAYFTTNTKDFRKSIANQIGVGIGDLKEPVVLVIKKNKSTLDNLIDWLKNNNPHKLNNYPLLLIDDEADHASINTSKEGNDATTINKKIRELLHLFDRSSYLGYTATPFANVFIDPETDNEMLGDDLFPRDFIINLDPPSNYIGPERIFSSEADLKIVKSIDDQEDFIPTRHKINFQPKELPPTLKEAIQVFILSRALRLLRGQVTSHNSMMINVSRYTSVQSSVMLLVDEYVKEIRQSVLNHYQLNRSEALKNTVMLGLHDVFEREFANTEHIWDDVQKVLKEAVSPIGVIEVNSSSQAEQLDYSLKNYPSGRNVVAVGGMSLSRGLTLEGLTVSYFLRNSIMYDTLMQMGRWFGYRDGYVDLCRIYMTDEAASWYAHISDATNELREEFRRMKAAGMSPKDFGLCVRSHPESLIVTARNKMRTGKSVLREVNLEGSLVETAILLKDADIVRQNLESVDALILDAKQFGNETESKFGYLWTEVPTIYILKFIERFNNHPGCQLTEKKPLKDYITWLNSHRQEDWDIVLTSPSHLDTSEKIARKTIPNIEIISQKRKSADYPHKGGSGIALNKHRVASRGLEKAGLSEEEVLRAEAKYVEDNPNGKNISDLYYRGQRRRPLLMLHLLDCRSEDDRPRFEDGIAAYGISFPGEGGGKKPEKLVEYVVNTIWWKNEYLDLLDDEENEDE